ncbi:MAG: hypothetical protein SGI74_02295 [Oligoflexia bacterium]|nr:hypothetical protein [Oligoflexia bacterium]
MNKTGRIYLQQTDREFLEMCCHFGYLTANHFAEWIYKGTIPNARRRLLMLCKAGYLRFVSRREEAGLKKVYIPNLEKLVGIVEDQELERGKLSCQSKPWFRSLSRHEDIVRDWAIRLQKAFPEADVDLDFMYLKSSENSNKVDPRACSLFPDITLRRWGKPDIAFEVELSRKCSSRYLRKLLSLLASPNRPTVYLVEDSSVFAAVHKQIDIARQILKRRNQQTKSEVLLILCSTVQGDGKLAQLVEKIESGKCASECATIERTKERTLKDKENLEMIS